MVCLLRLSGNAFRRQSHVIGSRSDVFPSGERESGGFAFITTQLSRCRLSFSASAPLMPVQAVPITVSICGAVSGRW